jgi:hypothetical protein
MAGKGTNVLQFFCWFVLKDADLGVWESKLTGDGIAGDDPPLPLKPTPTKKGSATASLAEALSVLRPASATREERAVALAERKAKTDEHAAAAATFEKHGELIKTQVQESQAKQLREFISVAKDFPAELQHLHTDAIKKYATLMGLDPNPPHGP